MSDDPIRLYAEYIIDAPDEWTPHFTRSELLPMARAYIENEKLRERLEEIKRLASDPFASESVALRACLLAAYEGLGLPGPEPSPERDIALAIIREHEGSWGAPYEEAMVDTPCDAKGCGRKATEWVRERERPNIRIPVCETHAVALVSMGDFYERTAST